MGKIRNCITAAATLCVAGTASAVHHVDGQGQEWLPLTTLTDYSWAEIDSVCQNDAEAPGACSGVLGGVDLTGWTWASRTEVVGLIGEFMSAAGDPSPPTSILQAHGYGTSTFAWAQALTAAFGVTAAPLGDYTFGFTNGGSGDYAWFCGGGPCGWASYAAASEAYGGRSEFFGAWFFRAAPVPEPASFVLMLAGAAVLARRSGRCRSGAAAE